MTPLLKSRRFLPLFITQFLGAFNDNVFKNALVIFITFRATGLHHDPQILVTLAAGLFILPYLLFSATAGQLADKLDRAKLARLTKTGEIIIMLIAAVGFMTHSIYFLLFVLFCLGVQATLFGPVKYALLPQHLHEGELIAGNAYIEAGTFLSILIGTIAGGLLIMYPGGELYLSAAIIICALGGYAASRYISDAPAPEPGLVINPNIAGETWNIIRYDYRTPRVFRSILGISWFWLVGATFLSQFPTYAKQVIGGDQTVVTLFLTVFSLGIGAGSMLCNKLLKGEVKSTYVTMACAGISLFTLDLYFASNGVPAHEGLWSASQLIGPFWATRIALDLFLIAVCGGLFAVPLYAIMQHDSDPTHRARTIASNNVMNAVFMVASAIATVALFSASVSVPQIFLLLAGLNGFVALYIRKIRNA